MSYTIKESVVNPQKRADVSGSASLFAKDLGHWELDTVVSSRGKSKACAATFVERKTRMNIASKMPDRTAHPKEVAFGVLASQYPNIAFQTATADPGKRVRLHCQLGNTYTKYRCTSQTLIRPGSALQ
ncbi:hypothetical protein M4D81_29635 [Paenibacillus sp. p3-SID867]|uniref:hypothetical protein n=1 Tax=Paenibacillus sp. p3-SID867 TaxID=2916363 RepID=UPI0021A6EFAE|nr:hypothetical protein [Paenibacillus sp. p3-SID867]MCT1403161.1 hypothetical protein [Paenibacillus sp. p3-SID867]